MNNSMDIECVDDVLIVKFRGELDNLNSFKYKEKLSEKIERNLFRNVIMDFQDVSFIDSAGIGLILGRYNQIRTLGGELKICGVNGYVDKLFNISGVWTILKKYQSIEMARVGVWM